MARGSKQRHQAQKRGDKREPERNPAKDTSSRSMKEPAAAAPAARAPVPNEPPASLLTVPHVLPPCAVHPQGVVYGPNAGMPLPVAGLYFPPHYCFLPPGQAAVNAAVPTPFSSGPAPPAAPVRFPTAVPHGVVGAANANNLVVPAAHFPDSAKGAVVQRPPNVPAASVFKPAVRRGKQRSTATGRRAAAVSSGRKTSGKRKRDSVDTTTRSSSSSSSVSSSPSEMVSGASSSSEEEEGEWAGKKDLLKMMETWNLPQPPPDCGAHRKRLVTTLMGVAVLVATLAITACLLAVLRDNWKRGVTDDDGETNANSTVQEPTSGLDSLEGIANITDDYNVVPNEYDPSQNSETAPDVF